MENPHPHQRNSIPFNDITNILCTERNPSISMFKPLILKISNEILKVQPHDDDIVQTMKLLIFEDFAVRVKAYERVDDILLLSSLLDLIFKALEFLDEQSKSKAGELLKEMFLFIKKTFQLIIMKKKKKNRKQKKSK